MGNELVNKPMLEESMDPSSLFKGGFISHGSLLPITARTMIELCNEINNISQPHKLVSVVFGEGRYHAIIEMGKTARINFEVENTNKKKKR